MSRAVVSLSVFYQQGSFLPEARSARALEIDSSPVSVCLCVCTFYYEPCDLVRSIALGMDILELYSKVCHNSLTSLKRAVFCFHMSGFESSTEHCFFRTFRVFSFFGTFRAHPISTSEGSFCVRLLVVLDGNRPGSLRVSHQPSRHCSRAVSSPPETSSFHIFFISSIH